MYIFDLTRSLDSEVRESQLSQDKVKQENVSTENALEKEKQQRFLKQAESREWARKYVADS